MHKRKWILWPSATVETESSVIHATFNRLDGFIIMRSLFYLIFQYIIYLYQMNNFPQECWQVFIKHTFNTEFCYLPVVCSLHVNDTHRYQKATEMEYSHKCLKKNNLKPLFAFLFVPMVYILLDTDTKRKLYETNELICVQILEICCRKRNTIEHIQLRCCVFPRLTQCCTTRNCKVYV